LVGGVVVVGTTPAAKLRGQTAPNNNRNQKINPAVLAQANRILPCGWARVPGSAQLSFSFDWNKLSSDRKLRRSVARKIALSAHRAKVLFFLVCRVMLGGFIIAYF
jgi:hypothetical protein